MWKRELGWEKFSFYIPGGQFEERPWTVCAKAS
jgi:hypothetical protein